MNEEFNREEFKEFVKDVHERADQYKEIIANLPYDVVNVVGNPDFVFRLDIIQHHAEEMVNFLSV